MRPLEIYRRLSEDVDCLSFSTPIDCVYNPLNYAWEAHELYVKRYCGTPREVLLVGMNPGPWGMTQTGVPFGNVGIVRDWLGIVAPIGRPPREHPKRPVLGFDCPRSEVSGARLWGWARERFQTPQRFFAQFYVHSYCPLCFMEQSGRNFTPDKLPAPQRGPLFHACDEALRRLVAYLKPQYLVGIGNFAESRLRAAFPDPPGVVGRIPHPSPASPAANRNWTKSTERALRELGIPLRN
ncbi:MAG: single-stranded DNA-binding protein [Candidatus Hydrogenedentes bacterium]|nr:single-stranded DNA-binding protein [Candidatus Hydrogenedentota bacterium]